MLRLLSVNPFIINAHAQLSNSSSYTHYWRIQSNLLTSVLGKNTAAKPELFQKYSYWHLGESKIQSYKHRKIYKVTLFSSLCVQVVKKATIVRIGTKSQTKQIHVAV